MNIITYNTAFSLYPYATFKNRKALMFDVQTHSTEAFNKYAYRGWTMLPNPPIPSHTSSLPSLFSIGSQRNLSDKYSWVIQLDVSGIALPHAPSVSLPELGWDPVTERGWKLDTHFSCGAEIMVFTPGISLNLFSWPRAHPNFQHVLPFLVPPRLLEEMTTSVFESRDALFNAIAWYVTINTLS